MIISRKVHNFGTFFPENRANLEHQRNIMTVFARIKVFENSEARKLYSFGYIITVIDIYRNNHEFQKKVQVIVTVYWA